MNTESRGIALVTGASRGIGKAIAAAPGRCVLTVIGTATSEGGPRRFPATWPSR